MDRFFLSALLKELDLFKKADTEFLRSATVSICFNKFPRPDYEQLWVEDPTARHDDAFTSARLITLQLDPNVELIMAEIGIEERVYALYRDQGEYRIKRVDRDGVKYLPFRHGENRNGRLISGIPQRRQYSDHMNEKLMYLQPAKMVKRPNETLNTLVGRLVGTHGKNLETDLHDLGYDATPAQRIVNALTSFVPFVICSKHIRTEQYDLAVLNSLMGTWNSFEFLGRTAKATFRAVNAALETVPYSIRNEGGKYLSDVGKSAWNFVNPMRPIELYVSGEVIKVLVGKLESSQEHNPQLKSILEKLLLKVVESFSSRRIKLLAVTLDPKSLRV